jgi:hypothetical protein
MQVKPWEPINFPSTPMPPRCALAVPFHHNTGVMFGVGGAAARIHACARGSANIRRAHASPASLHATGVSLENVVAVIDARRTAICWPCGRADSLRARLPAIQVPSQKLASSFHRAKAVHNAQPRSSLMTSAKIARSKLLALRHYTPVGMMCRILDMEAPFARLELFDEDMHDELGMLLDGDDQGELVKGSGWKQWSDQRSGKNLLVLDEEAEDAVAVPSRSSSAASFHGTAAMRRRPASAGPGGRPRSAAANRPTEERRRPASAHGPNRVSGAERHAPVFRDAVAFERLRTTLDKCPESTRLFKMLQRSESRGEQVRKSAVFRPSSAPPANATRRPLFSASPYAESPAVQLQSLAMPPKQQLRRPVSATPANRAGASNPFGGLSYTRPASATARSGLASTSASISRRLTYIPPRPASAGPRMNASRSTNDPSCSANSDRTWTIRPAPSATLITATSVSMMRTSSAGAPTMVAEELRGRSAASDLTRHLCAETGKCLADAGDEWETGTMIWRCHPSAYFRIPRYLRDAGDLMTLADMLTDAHFVTRGLICSSVEAMLAAINSAVSAMAVAYQQHTQGGDAESRHGGPWRRLSRIRHFQSFLRLHAQALDKEPYRFFALALHAGEGGHEHGDEYEYVNLQHQHLDQHPQQQPPFHQYHGRVGHQGHPEGSIHFVKYQVCARVHACSTGAFGMRAHKQRRATFPCFAN